MKKIGLYLGTFNPIHHGHITLANYFANNTDLDEVWVVLTPQNPFKKKYNLIEDDYRLEMANNTFNHLKNIKVSDIEFKLDKPNYTIDTINRLLIISSSKSNNTGVNGLLATVSTTVA